MRNLVPLTKIILTLGTAVWAIVLQKPESLLLLCLFHPLLHIRSIYIHCEKNFYLDRGRIFLLCYI